MKRVLVFQHVPYEILGTFHPLMRDEFRIRYINYGRKPYPKVEVDKYDGLIILGGPMGVYECSVFPHLEEEMEHIRAVIAQSKPVLGICLGAQLIAGALGAKVYKAPKREIGWHDVTLTEAGLTDPFLKHFEPTQKIFQWHGDTFDVPVGATLLAESGHCAQAFRYAKNVYGLQFHLEADEALIERWLKVPLYLQDLESAKNETSIEKIQSDTKKYIADQLRLSKKIFKEYIKLYSSRQRTLVLGSGRN